MARIYFVWLIKIIDGINKITRSRREQRQVGRKIFNSFESRNCCIESVPSIHKTSHYSNVSNVYSIPLQKEKKGSKRNKSLTWRDEFIIIIFFLTDTNERIFRRNNHNNGFFFFCFTSLPTRTYLPELLVHPLVQLLGQEGLGSSRSTCDYSIRTLGGRSRNLTFLLLIFIVSLSLSLSRNLQFFFFFLWKKRIYFFSESNLTMDEAVRNLWCYPNRFVACVIVTGKLRPALYILPPFFFFLLRSYT